MRPPKAHMIVPAGQRCTAACWRMAMGCDRIRWCINEGGDGLSDGQRGDLDHFLRTNNPPFEE